MMSYMVTQKPEWETTGNGWHAVVSPGEKGSQWTAYIEDSETSHWRMWAGCVFHSFEDAQNWCAEQMSHPVHHSISDHYDEIEERSYESEEWSWFSGDLEFMQQSEFMAH